MPSLTLAEIATLTGGRVEGDPARRVTGAAPPNEAGADDVTFVLAPSGARLLAASRAGAAILPEGVPPHGRDAVVVRNPQAAMAAVLGALHPEERPAPGVHPTAIVHPTAKLGPDVHVGPFCVIEREAVLGAGVAVGPWSYVGAECRIGDRTRLHPRVVIYPRTTVGRECILHAGVVLGADGFGYARIGGRHVKVPQVGTVALGDEVDVGANSCIDRGTMTPTRIGTNAKIDNLVQIGHNCVVGDRVVLCGQVGLAGSTIVEDDAVLGGQVGAAGHLTIGRGAMIGAQSGVTGDIAAGVKVVGHPPMDVDEFLRASVALRELPDMRKELRRLERRVKDLENGR